MKPDNCSDKKKFKTSQAATKSALRTKGIINTYLDILDYNKFIQANTNWSKDAKERFGIEEPLFYKEYNSMKAVFNIQAFHKIDAAKGVFYPENEYLRKNLFQEVQIEDTEFINEESKTEDIEEGDIVIEEPEIQEEFDEVEDILYKMSQKYGEKITIDDWNSLSLEQQEYLRECYG